MPDMSQWCPALAPAMDDRTMLARAGSGEDTHMTVTNDTRRGRNTRHRSALFRQITAMSTHHYMYPKVTPVSRPQQPSTPVAAAPASSAQAVRAA
jgi:hypothetical protein